MKLKKEGKRIMKKIIKLGTIIFCMMNPKKNKQTKQQQQQQQQTNK